MLTRIVLIADMDSVDAIFEKLGGTTAVARAIDVKPSAASEMRRRASIPVRYWPRLIAAAAGEGIIITNDELVAIHAAPATGEAA